MIMIKFDEHLVIALWQTFKTTDDKFMIKWHKIFKDVIAQVQISNLYIEKTCKVGSYFFGNGTTYEDEVKERSQKNRNKNGNKFDGKHHDPDLICHSNIFLKICDNLFNGSFPDEQEAVQKVVADVEMYSNLIKQVGKIIKN